MDNSNAYGWNDIKEPNSCDYLGDEVVTILKHLKPGSILDIGCGNGALCNLMSNELPEANIVGIDYDKEGVELASKHYPSISFYQYGVQDEPEELLAYENVFFDAVVSTEVVEHLFIPGLLPHYANKVLRSKGMFIITTPYHGYVKNLILSIMDKWDSHHTPLWNGGHIKFWSKNTLTKLLNDNGFDVLEFRGVGRFRYLWKSMILVCQKTN